jgi:hypothetical protein
VGLLAASFGLALFVSYILGPQINDYVYDSMFRAYRPPKPVQPESVVLAIDELTLMDCGGIRGIRRPIAQALRLLLGSSGLLSFGPRAAGIRFNPIVGAMGN